VDTNWKPNMELWRFFFFFTSILAIETLRNHFILNFKKINSAFWQNLASPKKGWNVKAGIRTLRRSYTLWQVHPRQVAWPDRQTERERERVLSRVLVVLEMVPCMCGRFKFRKCSSDECQLLLEIFLVWFMMQILHLHRTLPNCSVFGKRRVCIMNLKKRIVSCIVEATAARPLNIARFCSSSC
jgi:hypothetical protein